jgi:predicted porin
MMGSTDNVGVLMHASAPDVGRLGVEESVAHELFVRPATGGNDYVDYLDATWINTDGDANKISYITPTMYGMTLGATYVAGGPLTGDEGVTGQQMEQQNFEEGYVLAGMYSSEFSGVGVTMTGAYAMYNVGSNGYTVAGTDYTDQDVRTEWSAGTNLTYGGLTFGGAFRHVDMPAGTDNGPAGINQDGYAWNAGVSYEAGPYGVSLAYMKSEVEGTNANGTVNSGFQNDDKAEMYMLSGKYNLGAGVDTFASLAYVDYEDEVGNNVDASNVKDGVTKDADGWAFVTGVALAF